MLLYKSRKSKLQGFEKKDHSFIFRHYTIKSSFEVGNLGRSTEGGKIATL